MGRLADAAAVLQERYPTDAAGEVVSVLDAAGVAALGRVALHLGDQGRSRQVAQIARVMIDQGAPSVRRHAAWILALQAMADGDTVGAHRWLGAEGEDERRAIVPLFPIDVADEARLVHIALGVQDRELAVEALAAALEDLGVVALDGGATNQAVAVFSRALSLFAEAGAAWDAGRLRGRLR